MSGLPGHRLCMAALFYQQGKKKDLQNIQMYKHTNTHVCKYTNIRQTVIEKSRFTIFWISRNLHCFLWEDLWYQHMLASLQCSNTNLRLQFTRTDNFLCCWSFLRTFPSSYFFGKYSISSQWICARWQNYLLTILKCIYISYCVVQN